MLPNSGEINYIYKDQLGDAEMRAWKCRKENSFSCPICRSTLSCWTCTEV